MATTGSEKAIKGLSVEECDATLEAIRANRSYLQSLGTTEAAMDLRELAKEEARIESIREKASEAGEQNTATGTGTTSTPQGQTQSGNAPGDTTSGAGDSPSNRGGRN